MNAFSRSQMDIQKSSSGHAFLWIKTPGESDGSCGGGPQAGKWWADYALELSRMAEVLQGVIPR
jgi:cellulase/cellobiase CelA1